MTNQHDSTVTFGSGDVFTDLALELSAEDRIKIHIARQISRSIGERGLTQAQAGQVLDVDQAKVSNLTRGRVAGFSIERLMKFAAALGWDIDIELRPSGNDRGSLRIHAPASPRDAA